MKTPSVTLWLVAILIIAVVSIAVYISTRFNTGNPETAKTPQAQTERLTSFFLLRNIERLRDQAVSIQHREEGRKLLELAGVVPEPPSSSSSGALSPVSSLSDNPSPPTL